MRGGDILLDVDPRGRFLDYIQQAPGIDPFFALHDGQENLIPTAGYLFSAKIKVGEPDATVEIYRYDEGGYSVEEGRDRRNITGKLSGTEFLTAGRQTTIICTPNFNSFSNYPPVHYPTTSTRAGTPASITNLSGNARILGSRQIVEYSAADYLERRTFRSDCVGTDLGVTLWMQDFNRTLVTHRVVATARQAVLVGRAIGQSMGLERGDLNTFIAVAKKHVEMITPPEQMNLGIMHLLQRQVWRMAGALGMQGY